MKQTLVASIIYYTRDLTFCVCTWRIGFVPLTALDIRYHHNAPFIIDDYRAGVH